jgi:uncharacterized membrane protein
MGILDAVSDFLLDQRYWMGALAGVIASVIHSNSKVRSRTRLTVPAIIIALVALVFIANCFLPKRTIDLTQGISLLVMFGAAFYAVLCDVFRFGLARWLTKMHGEKWIKEIDYVYLGFGVIGVILSMTKIDLIGGHNTQYELMGPLVVMSAIVIRLVKTRADIEGWNKLPAAAKAEV